MRSNQSVDRTAHPQRVRRPVTLDVGSKEMNRDAQIAALSRFILEIKRLQDETHYAEDRPIYGMYLAQAAIILAKVAENRGVGDDVSTMERLFGNTWIKDSAAYNNAYSAWDDFKGLLTQSIHGMTVNERLFSLGLLDEYDKAVEKRSEDHLKAVLSKCFLTQENIRAIIDKALRRNG